MLLRKRRVKQRERQTSPLDDRVDHVAQSRVRVRDSEQETAEQDGIHRDLEPAQRLRLRWNLPSPCERFFKRVHETVPCATEASWRAILHCRRSLVADAECSKRAERRGEDHKPEQPVQRPKRTDKVARHPAVERVVRDPPRPDVVASRDLLDAVVDVVRETKISGRLRSLFRRMEDRSLIS